MVADVGNVEVVQPTTATTGDIKGVAVARNTLIAGGDVDVVALAIQGDIARPHSVAEVCRLVGVDVALAGGEVAGSRVISDSAATFGFGSDGNLEALSRHLVADVGNVEVVQPTTATGCGQTEINCG